MRIRERTRTLYSCFPPYDLAVYTNPYDIQFSIYIIIFQE